MSAMNSSGLCTPFLPGTEEGTHATYSDYQGAKASGLHALLLRRPGPEGEEEHKEPGEDLTNVEVVPSLGHVVEWVRKRNGL